MSPKYKLGSISISSSVDPNKLSTAFEGFSKAIIGAVGVYALVKGIDPASITNQVQSILAQVAVVIPAVFSLWNALVGIWGMFRKLIVTISEVKAS